MIKTAYTQSVDFVEQLAQEEPVRRHLTLLDERHKGTGLHSAAVGRFSVYLGVRIGLHDTELRAVGCAGLLHDIGKIYVPTGILDKRALLTEDEWEIVKRHPRDGFELLADFPVPAVKYVVVAYHELSKRNPYPRGGKDRRKELRDTPERRKSKPSIDNLATIVAFADAWEALASTTRPYRQPLGKDEIAKTLLAQLRGAEAYIPYFIEYQAHV